ncbi:WWP2 [Mytilus coruscus]|uniref:WWP2 n=1 Tax=Mytilus coruscus TaxID=42192 RepID=A0A6J8C6R4_MYTCO|nr:WWP2 [Mytilus coruscus]
MPHSFLFRLSNGKVISDCSALCGKCSSQLTQSKQPNKYIDNNLSADLVPECLQSLDIIQRRLISQIQSFMTIIILPGGQYAEKGLAIHFPLDMESYFKSLQTFQNENVLLVAYSNKRPQLESIPVAKVVNYESVRTVILWLKENNILYCGFPDLHTSTCLGDIIENQANSEDTHKQNEVQKIDQNWS